MKSGIQALARRWIRRSPPPADFRPRAVLVWTMRGIGNAVLTVPLLRAIRQKWPEAALDVIGETSAAPIFTEEGVRRLYDDAIPWVKWARLVWSLRGRYDLGLVTFPSDSFRKAAGLFAAGVPVRVAARDASCPPDRDFYAFYTEVVPRADRAHDVATNVSLLSPFGALPPLSRFVTRSPRRRTPLLIGVHAGAAPTPTAESKRWPLAHYVSLLNRLSADVPVRFRLFEGPGEVGAASQIASETRADCDIVAGQPDLSAIIRSIEECDYFLSNDSGLGHVASWCGVPGAAVYGSTDPRIVGLHGASAQLIEATIACHPCWDRYRVPAVQCAIDFACLKQLSADAVYQRVHSDLAALLARMPSVNP